MPSSATPVPTDRASLCAELRGSFVHRTVPAVRPVVIVASTGATLTDQADAFEIRTAALGRELCAAVDAADAAPPPPRAAARADQTVAEGTGGSLVPVTTAVDTIARLFRTDYRIYGIAVIEDEKLLSRAVAMSFMDAKSQPTNPVHLPELFPPSLSDASNPTLRRLALLDALHAEAVSRPAAGRTERLTAAIATYTRRSPR